MRELLRADGFGSRGGMLINQSETNLKVLFAILALSCG